MKLPDDSIVRIFNFNNKRIGIGFLLSENLVITCASGITDTSSSAELALPISLHFPLVQSGYKISSRIIFLDLYSDLVCLEINEKLPAGAIPAKLTLADKLWGHSVRTLGFAHDQDNGIWLKGTWQSLTDEGLFKIEYLKNSGFRIQQDFIGGPVWDDQLNNVIGIVKATENDKALICIPTRKLIATYPMLRQNLTEIKNSKGESIYSLSQNQDSSELKRTEQLLDALTLELEDRVLSRTAELQSAYEFLRESEATSRLILESMPDAIVITDREGRIVHANTQVESLFGYAISEVLGRPVEILLPERFHRQHVKNRDSYAGNRTRRIMGLGFDLFGRRKDNSEFPIDVMLSPIDNNTTWDMMVAIRDNTKQWQSQETLRINEEKLRTLFEILPVGISFLGKDGRIVDMNPALGDILGLSKQAILQGTFKGQRYIRADGTPMPPDEFANRRAIAEGKTIYNVETGIVYEHGDIKWTSVNAAPVRVADVEAVVVTVDITQRKQAEEAVHRHRESLKILSRRLVEIQEEERRAIARELHDRVSQKLAALTLNLNIVRSQSSDVKVEDRLNDSIRLLNEMLTIIRNMMADLHSETLDDYGLQAALVHHAEIFTQRSGIPVVFDSPAITIPRLNRTLEMILLRIAQESLTNVARHANATQVIFSLKLEEDEVHMIIRDNGIGILSWQKANHPGSHGLRIMRERAEAVGGFLQVNSVYNQGTQIEVKIPVERSSYTKAS